MPALATNRFGKKIGEFRWVYKREALMEYFNEVFEEPERMAALYRSMKPIYNEKQRVDGYAVDVQGEDEFFATSGLKNGDVFKSVNSLRMTSQSRAEYMIKEFVQNRLDTIVLDIEREGKGENAAECPMPIRC